MDQDKVLMRAEVPRELKQEFFSALAKMGLKFTPWLKLSMEAFIHQSSQTEKR